MNRRHILTALKMSLVAAFMAALSTSPAHANDAKIYPGEMCIAWNVNRYPSYFNGAIGNPSTTWLDVDCPVVHDSVNAGISSGVVRVIDQSGGEFGSSVSCTLMSVTVPFNNALSGWWSPSIGTSPQGYSINAQDLWFGSLPSNSNYHYFYSCHIPPQQYGRSYIVTYRVDEYDGTP